MREARYIISRGYVKVDGAVRRDYKFPVGLMDVIEIVPTGEVYRVVPDVQKYYALLPISSQEASLKLLRIEGKTSVRGGKIQLHFHDGRNLIVPQEVGRQFKTFDTILYDLHHKAVREHIPMKLGNYVVVTHGGNVGFSGQLYEIVWTLKRRQSVVAIKRGEEVKRTILNYIMAVGTETPVIKITP
jgi:SSU ribosomal protein S4E